MMTHQTLPSHGAHPPAESPVAPPGDPTPTGAFETVSTPETPGSRVAAALRGIPVVAFGRGVGVFVFSLACGVAVLAAGGFVANLISPKDIPNPMKVFAVLWELLSDPFYNAGPNDKGIGLQLWASLQRVFTGFAIGSVVAIPLGMLLGSNKVLHRLFDPIVQILRPVSPLAWFPIGLATFQAAGNATIFMIFITSLWPTVINTAFGVASVPVAYKQVAQVFQFSRGKYIFKVLLPYSLPHILTGLRLSMGIAWLVIVAGEMLSGNTGIGFFIWDSWNSLSLERVMSAILLIGVIGLVLDRAFGWLITCVSYTEAD